MLYPLALLHHPAYPRTCFSSTWMNSTTSTNTQGLNLNEHISHWFVSKADDVIQNHMLLQNHILSHKFSPSLHKRVWSPRFFYIWKPSLLSIGVGPLSAVTGGGKGIYISWPKPLNSPLFKPRSRQFASQAQWLHIQEITFSFFQLCNESGFACFCAIIRLWSQAS